MFLHLLVRCVQKILFVKEKRVFFNSLGGHYCDNPKYISQKMYELRPDLEQIWLIKEQYRCLLPNYVKTVSPKNVWKRCWYEGTAHILVDCVFGNKVAVLKKGKIKRLQFWVKKFLYSKKSQHVFTTWHGTPLKRIGSDQPNSGIIDFSLPQTMMLLGNQYTADIVRRTTFDRLKVDLIGTPKNDILFKSGNNSSALKAELGLPAGKKIVLFAPSFRSDAKDGLKKKNVRRSGINQIEEIDFSVLFKTLNKVFSGEWVLVCRFHYHVAELVDWNELEEKYHGCIINGNLHNDMAEYLACTDVLITDVSASMFDFAVTEKPCFLFFPDMEHYKNIERGFYMNIEELPFPVSISFTELIKDILEFDNAVYTLKVRKLLNEMGYVDDADSSDRVVKYILEKSF